MLNQTEMEALWSKLNIRYGEAWNRKWGTLDPALVLNDWQECLEGVTVGQIRYVLKNLPEYPPNANQFVQMCWAAPAERIAALEPLAIAAPGDMNDSPEEMARRQAAYERFREAYAGLKI